MKATYQNINLIVQNENQVKRLTKAFELLKVTDQKIWKKALTLKSIKVRDIQGYDNELFPAKRIWECDRLVVEKNIIDYLASLVLHEAFHLIQYDRGTRNISSRAEKAAYLAQKNFLIKIGRQNYASAIMRDYKKLYTR